MRELKAGGAEIDHRLIDLMRTQPLVKVIDEILAETRVDILVNNAGFDRPGITAKIDKNDYNAVLSIHLGVPFLLSKLLLPNMRANRWGRIVNISSIYGLMGAKGEVAYAAAKAGVLGLTKTLAREGGIVAARSHVAGAAEIEYGRVSLLAGDNGCHDGGYS